MLWRWAVDRELIHKDGTPNKATPLAQAEKTLEEIGEAKLFEVAISLVLASAAKGLDIVNQWECVEQTVPRKDLLKVCEHIPGRMITQKIVSALEHCLSLELGDILITLSIQARMQKSSLDECRRGHYFNPKMPAFFRNRSITWQFVDDWGLDYQVDICQHLRALELIGALYYCVADAAQTMLALSTDECFVAAYKEKTNA